MNSLRYLINIGIFISITLIFSIIFISIAMIGTAFWYVYQLFRNIKAIKMIELISYIIFIVILISYVVIINKYLR